MKTTSDLPSNTSSKSAKTPEIKEASKCPEVLQRLIDGEFKNVIFMVGAGISTAAGIPDFRTPGTGLYSNLEKLKLPYAEAVFDIDYLRERPEAFYTIAKDMNPEKFQPTDFHKLIKWVDDQGYLRRCYTQNIDTLERRAGIDPSKIIEAHGSFHGNHCIDCSEEFDSAKMDKHLAAETIEVPRCEKCEGVVKPDIVFFGESLPTKFFDSIEVDFDEDVDLVIVAGTSLQVQPFAQLPDMVHHKCPRVLFNREKVGTFGKRPADSIVLGDLADISRIMPSLFSNAENSHSSEDPTDTDDSPPEDSSTNTHSSESEQEEDSLTENLANLRVSSEDE